MSENSRYYSIPLKHHKSVKIMERETNQCVANVQLDFRIRDIIFSSDMNLFVATDGYILSIYYNILESNLVFFY